ncbi:MAG: hypothetical protein GQ468_02845 [Candidatus Scalindua sp.]|nr:hypothetical protein [Candidatus Scalindua sp.]
MKFGKNVAIKTMRFGRKKGDYEHEEQVTLFKWVDMMAKFHPMLKTMYAIPNGGDRNAVVAMKLKNEGVKAGMPDMHLPVACSGYTSLYLELKVKNGSGVFGKESDDQRTKRLQLNKVGNLSIVVFGYLQAIDIITDYMTGEKEFLSACLWQCDFPNTIGVRELKKYGIERPDTFD